MPRGIRSHPGAARIGKAVISLSAFQVPSMQLSRFYRHFEMHVFSLVTFMSGSDITIFSKLALKTVYIHVGFLYVFLSNSASSPRLHQLPPLPLQVSCTSDAWQRLGEIRRVGMDSVLEGNKSGRARFFFCSILGAILIGFWVGFTSLF